MIPYSRQSISQQDIDAVIDVLRSDYLTQGPVVPSFEQAIADYCGVNHVVAVSNATNALHLACLSLNIGQGDIVWTSPTTFVASANCALYCGATVDFVDIDPRTYNMSVEKLTNKLVQAEIDGTLPKVIIPVHLCGQSCNMAEIYKLSQQYGFKIIEDASHAIGAKYKDEPVGNCKYSDITVFSFHPVKIITTGEGGAALTNNPELANKLRLLRSHGISNTSLEMHERPMHEIWNYQQITLGYNYRMTDIQAALGLSQLSRIDEFVEKRSSIAARYATELSGLPLQTPWQHPDTQSSFHLYPICIDSNESKVTQRGLYEGLKASGINVNLHYIPVYRQPYYEALGFKAGYCPEAEKYHRQAISIPLHPSLTEVETSLVINAIKKLAPRGFD